VWAYWHGVELDYSRPGKPTDNPFVESCSAKLHLECLDEDWLAAIEGAQEMLEAWRADYAATGRTALYSNPTQ
jgi:putative transposase